MFSKDANYFVHARGFFLNRRIGIQIVKFTALLFVCLHSPAEISQTNGDLRMKTKPVASRGWRGDGSGIGFQPVVFLFDTVDNLSRNWTG